MVAEPLNAERPKSGTEHQRFVVALAQAVIGAERRLGRSIKRTELARRVNVSPASLYAYLNGTTLPSSATFDRLVVELGLTGSESGELGTLRDRVEVGRRSVSARSVLGAAEHEYLDPWPAPAQFPPAPGLFVGRKDELRQLDQMLIEHSTHARIALLTGTPGVGKTALALRWCHLVADQFPDGQLFVNLRGHERSAELDAEEALHRFLGALGVPPTSAPAGIDAKTDLYRSLLARKRVLILVDNAASAAHVRPLLPGAGPSLVVVTSRDKLISLGVREGARRIAVDLPSTEDARTQLTLRVGDARTASEPDAVHELIRLCARLPLAISLVAAHVADEDSRSLEALATELVPERRLDILDEEDLNLRSVFRRSYVTLGDRESELFRGIGLHPGPTVDGYVAAALLGIEHVPDNELRRLRNAHLIIGSTGRSFVTHDLLRSFAAELIAHRPAERTVMLRRLADYYVAAAAAANECIQPCAAEVLPLDRIEVLVPTLTTYQQGMAWFGEELEALQGMVRLAADSGLEPHAWQLAWSCTTFLRRTGRRAERAALHEIALTAAARNGNRPAYATTLRLLADARARLGEYATAQQLLSMSLQDCVDRGDHIGIRQAHLSCVRVCDAQARHREALEHARAALSSLGEDAAPLARADVLTALANQYCALGHFDEALKLATTALSCYAESGYSEGQASVLVIIGRSELAAGRLDEAAIGTKQALAIDRHLGDRYWEARTLLLLADVQQRKGDLRSADHSRARSARILDSLGYSADLH